MDPSHTRADSAVLALVGELTIYRAAELRAELLAALDGGRSVQIDLSGVTEVDTAGLQLLLVATRTAAARGSALLLLRPSEAVIDALGLVNLGYLLDRVETPRLGLA